MEQSSTVGGTVLASTDRSEHRGGSNSAGLCSSSDSSTSSGNGSGGHSSSPNRDTIQTSTASAEATDMPRPQPQPSAPQEAPQTPLVNVYVYGTPADYHDCRYTFIQAEDGTTHLHVVVVSQRSLRNRLSTLTHLCRPLQREPRIEDVDESDDEAAAWEQVYRARRYNWRPVSSSGGGMSRQEQRDAQYNQLMVDVPRLVSRRRPEHVLHWARQEALTQMIESLTW